MKLGQSHLPAAPVYERAGIAFLQATYREIHLEGDRDALFSGDDRRGQGRDTLKGALRLPTIVTAPAARFDKADGLGPERQRLPVCMPSRPRRQVMVLEAGRADAPRRDATLSRRSPLLDELLITAGVALSIPPVTAYLALTRRRLPA